MQKTILLLEDKFNDKGLISNLSTSSQQQRYPSTACDILSAVLVDLAAFPLPCLASN